VLLGLRILSFVVALQRSSSISVRLTMRCENCVTQLQILKDRISRVWKQHPLAEDNVHHDVITPIHHVVSELSAPTATPLPPSGPSLTGLPPELRLLIFGHLLPRNKVLRLVTHGTARPFYEVLAINKQIHAELRPLFYGRNRFVVTRKEFTHSNLCWTLLHMDTPADAPIRYMRSVSICIQTAPPYKSRLPMIADTSFVAIWLELFYLLRTVPLKLALYFAFWPEDLCDIEMDVSESFDTLVEQDFRGPGKAGWAILGEKGKVPQCQDIYGLRLGSTTDDDVGSHAAMVGKNHYALLVARDNQ